MSVTVLSSLIRGVVTAEANGDKATVSNRVLQDWSRDKHKSNEKLWLTVCDGSTNNQLAVGAPKNENRF